MLAHYLYWQYLWGPRWLLLLYVNLQLALLNLFSIRLMVRTLFSPWHRDVVPYHGGTLSNLAFTFSWNIISRLIGALIRSCVIILWLLIESVVLPLYVIGLLFFLSWPLLVIFSLPLGLIYALVV